MEYMYNIRMQGTGEIRAGHLEDGFEWNFSE